MWEDLVSSAIVGTASSPPALDAQSPAVAELVRSLDSTDAESLLLTCAGVQAAWRAAGRQPEKTNKAPSEPSPVDTRPALGRRASHYLHLVLQIDSKGIVSEFLEAVAATGKRISPELLPTLLDAASDRPELVPLVRQVQGSRGDWLARQQSKWQAAATPSDDAWETGDKAERLELLSAIRRTDPGRGRALLESTWMDEPSKDRADFLKALSIKLSRKTIRFFSRRCWTRSRRFAARPQRCYCSYPNLDYIVR